MSSASTIDVSSRPRRVSAAVGMLDDHDDRGGVAGVDEIGECVDARRPLRRLGIDELHASHTPLRMTVRPAISFSSPHT